MLEEVQVNARSSSPGHCAVKENTASQTLLLQLRELQALSLMGCNLRKSDEDNGDTSEENTQKMY